MANSINPEDCIGCGNCELDCIHWAIVPDGEIYRIDPQLCDGCENLPCGCRCLKLCPTQAIVPGRVLVVA